MRKRVIRLGVWAGVLGPVIYGLLLMWLGHRWEGYNPVRQSMSELGGVGSPYMGIMNIFGFSLLGVMTVLFALSLGRLWKGDKVGVLAAVSLLGGGIFMFLVGFFPCDAGCIDVTWVGRMHSVMSTPPSILMPLAAMLAAKVVAKKWGGGWGLASFWLGLGSMMAGPVMFLPTMTEYLGLVQRLGIGLSLVWMELMALRLLSGSVGAMFEDEQK